MKKNKKSFDYYFPYGFDNKPQPEQLIYLAISIAVVLAAFITLILI